MGGGRPRLRARSAVARVLLVVLVLLVPACSSSEPAGGKPSPSPSPSPSAAPSPSPSALAAPVGPVVDWGAIPPSVDLGGGWSVGDCGGTGPFLCVRRAGRNVGVVELSTFPVDSFTIPAFRDAVAKRDTTGALSALANDLYSSVRKDRATICGAGYSLDALPPKAATVSGGPGIRYGFTGRNAGKVVESQESYSTLRDGRVVIQSASAFALDGCMVAEAGELTPQQLAEFSPLFERLAASSKLPPPR
ncbi:MAG TPA: hypothetical protein VII47_07055 [Actinomycetota bacterium]